MIEAFHVYARRTPTGTLFFVGMPGEADDANGVDWVCGPMTKDQAEWCCHFAADHGLRMALRWWKGQQQ